MQQNAGLAWRLEIYITDLGLEAIWSQLYSNIHWYEGIFMLVLLLLGWVLFVVFFINLKSCILRHKFISSCVLFCIPGLWIFGHVWLCTIYYYFVCLFLYESLISICFVSVRAGSAANTHTHTDFMMHFLPLSLKANSTGMHWKTLFFFFTHQ